MVEQGKTYITNFYGTNVMKIQILEVTEKTVLWKNLDSSNKNHTCRSTLDDFTFNNKIIEEIEYKVLESIDTSQIKIPSKECIKDGLQIYIEVGIGENSCIVCLNGIGYDAVGLQLDIDPDTERHLIQWLDENQIVK